jgi:hypothetical protein
MNQDRSLVRASDIGLWAYCHRAWWLAKVKGAPHRNPAVLESGVVAHATHGRQVALAGTLQRLGLLLIAVALALAVLILILWLVQQ